MTALIARIGEEVDAIDLFCGGGGSSQGIHAAGASVRVAANHSALALECHSLNYPDVDHRLADLSDATNPYTVARNGRRIPGGYIDPADLPPARFMWASPSCRFHSPANAKKLYERGPQGWLDLDMGEDDFDHDAYANSERSRVTMVCPLRYASRHRPELVVVENVVEAAKWGPNRDGSTFRWWLEEWVKLDYDYECLYLNAMFFPPCPQNRDRLYVAFWKRKNRRPNLAHTPLASCTSDACQGNLVQAIQTWKRRTKAWPLEPWGKYGARSGQYFYTCPACTRPVDPVAWPAYTAVNWNNLGESIGERKARGKPPAPSTEDRIRRALAKFHGTPPIVIPVKSVWGTDSSVCQPFPTQTTQQDKALVVDDALTVSTEHGGSALRFGANRSRLIADAHPAITGVGGIGFIVKHNGAADEAQYRGQHLGEPTGSITAHPAQTFVNDGMVLPVYGNTSEREGQTTGRSLADQLFSLHGTEAFGFAHTPAMIRFRGDSDTHPAGSVIEPVGTISAGGFNHGIATPGLFSKFNGGPGDTAWHNMAEALNTITGRDTTALLVLPWVEQWRSDPVAVTQQLATVMSHLRHALATSPGIPLEQITDEDLDNVRFRMFEPEPELLRGMAFGDDYRLIGSKTDRTSLLGNAVVPPVASWITERMLASLDTNRERWAA